MTVKFCKMLVYKHAETIEVYVKTSLPSKENTNSRSE